MKLIPVLLLVVSLALVPWQGNSQTAKPKSTENPPALSAITLEDLKKDLYEMADDHFRGRASGTIDELKASAWWAVKMKEAGLQPAGDDGTFFQFFTLWRNRINPSSTFRLGDQTLTLWKDVLVTQIAPCSVSAPVIFLGNVGELPLDKIDLKGKAVMLQVTPEGINKNLSILEWRYHRAVMTRYVNDLTNRGAAAIIFISDEFAEHSWPYAQENLIRGVYDIPGGQNVKLTPKPPVLWLHQNGGEFAKKPGTQLNVVINMETFEFPSVNIVGKIPGKDLSAEYVLFSGHQDAHGIRNPENSDTVYRGADDNASVNVAMLAVARAFKKVPGRRSALFVFHGAEERGLFGSRWYSAHPTVPISSVVAVLNGDMIGRNNPDSAAVLGTQSPHRNSQDLATMALQANQEGPKFMLDTLWDKPGHPEFWYFRSDHLPYARLGIPALMYSTLLHADYHTPRDDAKRIDYPKLKKMTEWIYRTGWKVANANQRPRPDPGFKLER